MLQIAAAAAAAAAVTATVAVTTAAAAAPPPRRRWLRRQRFRDGGGTKKKNNFTKNEIGQITKNLRKIDENQEKTSIQKKRMSLSNSTRKTMGIDLFSSLYD